MSEAPVFPVPAAFAADAHINEDRYFRDYEASVADPEAFWAKEGRRIDWIKPYSKIRDVDFTGDVRIRWFYDGTLNVSANCLDRHLEHLSWNNIFHFFT